MLDLPMRRFTGVVMLFVAAAYIVRTLLARKKPPPVASGLPAHGNGVEPAAAACQPAVRSSTAALSQIQTLGTKPPPTLPYGYDVLRGAAAYAPILGGMGGFVVAAVVLVFTFAPEHALSNQHALLGRATGLLVLALVSCLLGAFALAAIGAERTLTANLPAAVLYAGATAAIGVVALMVAFEVLAAIFLPGSKSLFAMLVVGAEVSAGVLVALVLGDAWIPYEEHPELGAAKRWLGSEKKATLWATGYCVAAVVLLGVATAMYFCKVWQPHTSTEVLIAVGIALSVISGIASVFRTWHLHELHSGVTWPEALIVLGGLVGYLFLLTVSMP
ncbi:MAG: hypothetical protein ACLP01_25165 [Solirubrobacteraceae bacterium]